MLLDKNFRAYKVGSFDAEVARFSSLALAENIRSLPNQLLQIELAWCNNSVAPAIAFFTGFLIALFFDVFVLQNLTEDADYLYRCYPGENVRTSSRHDCQANVKCLICID